MLLAFYGWLFVNLNETSASVADVCLFISFFLYVFAYLFIHMQLGSRGACFATLLFLLRIDACVLYCSGSKGPVLGGIPCVLRAPGADFGLCT